MDKDRLFQLHIEALSLALDIQDLYDKNGDDTRIERIMNKAWKRLKRRHVKLMRTKSSGRYA